MATGIAAFFKSLHTLFAYKEMGDVVIGWIGRLINKKDDPSAAKATTGEQGQQAEPKMKTDKVDSFGKADDLGLKGLMALFGVSDRPVKAEVTVDDLEFFGLYLAQLTDGEGAALLRIIAHGGSQEITVSVVREIPGVNPGDPPQRIEHKYPVKAALPGISFIHGVANYIKSAGDNPEDRKKKAAELAQHMRKLDILDNLGDDFGEAWNWLVKRVRPDIWHDLHRIANCLGGWQPVRTMLSQPIGHRLWQAYFEAKPEEASLRRDALIDHLSREAQLILRLPKERQQHEWGIKPIRSRYWWRFYICVVVAAIVALIWAMYPTHPV